MNNQELTGQVALITGGGQGIGAEACRQFAQAGCKVVVADWNEEAAQAVVEELKASGTEAIALGGDVSNREVAQGLVHTTVETFGRIDILINNAGITRDASLLKMEPHQWEQVIAVNLSALFYLSQAAAQHMKPQGYGRIISTSSISAFGNFGQANYAASKAGVVGLTRTLAIELARSGVTVNAVAPGFIQTSMTDAIPEDIKAAMIQKIPVQRGGIPLDIARTYRFLASPEAGFITGQLIVVDGGTTLVH